MSIIVRGLSVTISLSTERGVGSMKHQYVGDVNDYRKYALLRVLAAGGMNRIGVCWMRTPPDDTIHGNKLAYLKDTETEEGHDPDLFNLMKRASEQPDWRRLDTIEASGAIPRATYFNEEVPVGIRLRRAYMERGASPLVDSDLVFFDPDTASTCQACPRTERRAGNTSMLMKSPIPMGPARRC